VLFHSLAFLIFFVVVLACFYSLPYRYGKLLLLAASYFFYAYWNWKFVPLLLALTAVDYTAGILIETVREDRRRWALLFSLVANLGFLGFFKYFNFIATNLAILAGKPPTEWTMAIVLPVGISFHTFQSISYVVDVYRKEQTAIRNPLDYALFIAFFPQLVAGPIVRARDFFRDLYHWIAPSYEKLESGAWLFLTGLAKKILFADHFGRVADAYFADPHAAPGCLAAWGGTIAFAMQVYFDFSGYTDMAIGCARMLGFEFPENFRRPFLALGITEFWRRWHISLSTWLRDYLYIPLGGSRYGSFATYRNLMITMLLGGLWHGAAWQFVLWGGSQGMLLSLERMTGKSVGLLQFPLFCVGMGIFRPRTIADSGYVLGQMFTLTKGMPILTKWHWGLIAVSLLLALLEERWRIFERFHGFPAWCKVVVVALILLASELFGVTEEAIPYVYFQF